ncbi:MAG: rRNA maturation RNase YbeY [Anaerolineales bacterium]
MISIVFLLKVEKDIKENWQAILHEAAEAALKTSEWKELPAVTIVLGDDDYLMELNHQFMGIDQPTDVLSFYIGETNPEDGSYYLGDLAISLTRAKSQADTGNHSVEDELRLLVVHGVLHLLGYDHSSAEEKRQMWSAQAKIMQSLGSNLLIPIE